MNVDNNPIPQNVFFNNVPYYGEASFINGFNGYTKTKDDSIMCAIVNHSAFTDGKPNVLVNEDNDTIHSENKRGKNYVVLHEKLTYGDIYNLVMADRTVITTSYYNNTRTYFKNEKGEARQRFNNCRDSYFNEGSDVEVNKLFGVEIL